MQSLSCQEEILEMTRHDQELLAKQLWATSSPPRQQSPTIIGLMIVTVFLVGIGVGDILSKTKQANTNYAALISTHKAQQ
jgi:hypothetical protein